MGPEILSLSVDPTLHKKRILCLHGGGTNARIFRAQCRILERRLQSVFRLCYAEAPFLSQPGPDVVSVYKDYGPFKAWLRWRPEDPEWDENNAIDYISEALFKAMAEDDKKGATGEWVGLLGFSQGAKICASLLHMQQIYQDEGMYHGSYQRAREWPNFQFGVLFAGRGPLVSLIPDRPIPHGLIDAAASIYEEPKYPPTELVEIPTIHVHGLQDPGLHLHQRLLHDYFDKRQIVLQEWDGGHRMPIKTKDLEPLVEEMISMAAITGVASSFGCY